MTEWSRSPERGAAWLVRLMLWLMRRVPWFAERIVLPGISAWFFLRSAGARAASREYLGIALARPASLLDIFWHIHVFAESILDRVLLLVAPGRIAIETQGLDHVEALAMAGRGGVLLGGHLGSFAVLRGLAAQCPVPVKMLLHTGNAGPFSKQVMRMDPSLASDVIPIGDVQSMLRVREAVAAGALVGILADRAPAGARTIMAPFFGQPAAFPTGPFILAAGLDVPVLTFRGVRIGPRRYRVEFAPFSDRLVLRRASRLQDLTGAATRYARWLEEGCRAHPYNWFNFFPFWQHAPDGGAAAGDVPVPGASPASRAAPG